MLPLLLLAVVVPKTDLHRFLEDLCINLCSFYILIPSRDQKQLVELKASDVDEIVLHTEEGELLEGVQTNFYAILSGKVRMS